MENLKILTSSEAAKKILLILENCEEGEVRQIFAKLFEFAPNYARVISQAHANFEGTQSVKPQSNATQVEYIDDYLDRLRGEETDFYK